MVNQDIDRGNSVAWAIFDVAAVAEINAAPLQQVVDRLDQYANACRAEHEDDLANLLAGITDKLAAVAASLP